MSVHVPLEEKQVHVWTIVLALEAAADLLDEEEREKAARFKFDHHRRSYIASHDGLRRILANYVDEDPRALRFEAGEHGKPSLVGHDLHFNLSHSYDYALVAVAGEEVGVDIERIGPVDDLPRLAQKSFSAAEIETLEALPAAQRNEGFFTCWTRKEAVIKALGEGLSHPLDAFDVAFAPGEDARVLAFRGCDDDPAAWTLADLEVPDGYRGAVAIRSPGFEVLRRR